jgi:curved DNA-binding protein CbpA
VTTKKSPYDGFIFNPADLAEEVDLEIERRKEILFLHANLKKGNLFQLFGLPWGAAIEDVRRAYYEKARIFHPDRFAGKKLGSYKPKVEAIFRAMSEASAVLTDPVKRLEYEEKHAPADVKAVTAVKRIDEERRAAERRARLARHNPLMAQKARMQEFLDRGKKAMEAGNFVAAANEFLLAAAMDAKAEEPPRLAAEAKRRAASKKADDAYEKGERAEALNNMDEANACYREAAVLDPENTRYAMKVARILLAAGDLDGARPLVETVLKHKSTDVEALLLLGEIHLAIGNKPMAKKSFERVLELSPDHDAAKVLLKKMRWSLFS